MEDTLRVCSREILHARRVLILILMEDTLRAENREASPLPPPVLILILMEDTLRVHHKKDRPMKDKPS